MKRHFLSSPRLFVIVGIVLSSVTWAFMYPLAADPFSGFSRRDYIVEGLYNPVFLDVVSGGNKELVGENFDVFTINGNSITKTISSPLTSGKVLGYEDFSNDSLTDIVASDGIYLNQGDGTFERVPHTIKDFQRTICGDFNNDGNLDMAGFIYNYQYQGIQILFGDGKGGYWAEPLKETSKVFRPAAVQDFDHDGNLDILVSYQYTFEPGISITLPAVSYGNGKGNFDYDVVKLKTYGYGTFGGAICYDFNHDGYIDILINLHEQIELLINDLSGGFFSTWASEDYGRPLKHIMIDDRSGDNPDVILLFQQRSTEDTTIETATFSSNGDGTFQQPEYDLIQDIMLSFPSYIHNEDVDQDGIDDIIIMGESDGAVTPVTIFFSSDMATSVEESASGQTLGNFIAVYPNPANPVSYLQYSITEPSHVTLAIYSLSGQKVSVLVDDYHDTGVYTAVFNGAGMASGVYLFKFESKSFSTTGKLLIMK